MKYGVTCPYASLVHGVVALAETPVPQGFDALIKSVPAVDEDHMPVHVMTLDGRAIAQRDVGRAGSSVNATRPVRAVTESDKSAFASESHKRNPTDER